MSRRAPFNSRDRPTSSRNVGVEQPVLLDLQALFRVAPHNAEGKVLPTLFI